MGETATRLRSSTPRTWKLVNSADMAYVAFLRRALAVAVLAALGALAAFFVEAEAVLRAAPRRAGLPPPRAAFSWSQPRAAWSVTVPTSVSLGIVALISPCFTYGP